MDIYKTITKMFYNRIVKPTPPEVGSQWQMISNKGPWALENLPIITIRDVKDGWVRYRMGNSRFDFLFQDERLPIETFLNIYEKMKEQ